MKAFSTSAASDMTRYLSNVNIGLALIARLLRPVFARVAHIRVHAIGTSEQGFLGQRTRKLFFLQVIGRL
jgi:hypothetical protein